jgi:carboxypeptidase Q
MSPLVDGSRYFIYHHTPADTVERIDPRELAACAAGIAVLAFVVADLPMRLGN